jgi:hypothetical protein
VQTFVMTFLGEWGDRSQIATIAMAAGQDYWWVTAGALCGHAICTAAAVIGGRAIAGRVSLKVGELFYYYRWSWVLLTFSFSHNGRRNRVPHLWGHLLVRGSLLAFTVVQCLDLASLVVIRVGMYMIASSVILYRIRRWRLHYTGAWDGLDVQERIYGRSEAHARTVGKRMGTLVTNTGKAVPNSMF